MYFRGARSPANAPHCSCRFLGIYGAYFSLQYLSLSDATVLTFVTPILTGLSGAVFLSEPLSIREALAGCKQFYTALSMTTIYQMIVCSFIGVVLISRPQFLFGSPQDPSEVTPTQRMLSVMSESLLLVPGNSSHLIA